MRIIVTTLHLLGQKSTVQILSKFCDWMEINYFKGKILGALTPVSSACSAAPPEDDHEVI